MRIPRTVATCLLVLTACDGPPDAPVPLALISTEVRMESIRTPWDDPHVEADRSGDTLTVTIDFSRNPDCLAASAEAFRDPAGRYRVVFLDRSTRETQCVWMGRAAVVARFLEPGGIPDGAEAEVIWDFGPQSEADRRAGNRPSEPLRWVQPVK